MANFLSFERTPDPVQVLRRSKTTERPEGVWAAAVYGGGDTTLKVKRDCHGDFHGDFFCIFRDVWKIMD